MVLRKRRVVGACLALLLALGALWILRTRRDAGQPPPAARAEERGARDVPEALAGPSPGAQRDPAVAVEGAAAPAPPPRPATHAAAPRPEDGPDGQAWRQAKLAFGLRELGRMGPYVKVGLDAARRDMEFCFREAGLSAGAPPPSADPDAPAPPPPDPAVLQLYLEAREGALDVVDVRVDHRGAATPELLECCRDVLQGLEIRTFGGAPGRRYRMKYRLH
jgi:hypothetical protein